MVHSTSASASGGTAGSGGAVFSSALGASSKSASLRSRLRARFRQGAIRQRFPILVCAFVLSFLTIYLLAVFMGYASLPMISSTTSFVEQTSQQALEQAHNKEMRVIKNLPRAAQIVTCPACRLSALPLVREFVYEHAKFFKPALSVKFSYGEDPRLIIYEYGKSIKEIDLAPYNSRQIIRKLYEFGIRPNKRAPVIRAALGDNFLLQKVSA